MSAVAHVSETFDRAQAAVKLASSYLLNGVVTDVAGLVIEGNGPFVPVGSNVSIRSGAITMPAQVVGFRSDRVLLMPYGEIQGIAPGAEIVASGASAEVLVSDRMLGRVIDAMGNPIDGERLEPTGSLVPLYRAPPNPITRERIKESFDLGVRAINSMLTIGVGQRVGIMAGSGVGKSTLLGMIAKHSTSDINAIRGRESC